MEPGVHSGERSVSYPELFGRAARLARGYDALGVHAGDRVALLLRNDIAFIEASLACAALGATPVPINWHWRADEVGYLLRDCAASALVVHDDLWPAVAGAAPDGIEVVGVPPPPEVRAAYGLADAAGPPRRYEEWLAEFSPWDQPPERSPQSIIYTSGTTGRPKGVVRREQSEEDAEAARGIIERLFRLRDGARTVIPAPLYHTAPNTFALSCAVRMLDMTLMPRFDAEELLRIVQERRVTTVQVVPTMFVRLLQLAEAVRARYDTSSLETVVHAAAPCPPAVKQAMIEWLGPVVDEYYGSTETGPVVFCTSEEWLAHPGTVGRALPGGVVKVIGPDGRELAPGQSGEVFVRLDVFPDFAYHGDDAKRAAIERDGLFTAGDVGCLDADGYLYLNDRATDMVISGGVNIYPAEIEACLLELDGVRDCAVFGIPDEAMGEALAAHVDADPAAGLTAGTVREHVAARLARYKVPRVVEFNDPLPREDTGKVFKRLLRERYWSGRERAI